MFYEQLHYSHVATACRDVQLQTAATTAYHQAIRHKVHSYTYVMISPVSLLSASPLLLIIIITVTVMCTCVAIHGVPLVTEKSIYLADNCDVAVLHVGLLKGSVFG